MPPGAGADAPHACVETRRYACVKACGHARIKAAGVSTEAARVGIKATGVGIKAAGVCGEAAWVGAEVAGVCRKPLVGVHEPRTYHVTKAEAWVGSEVAEYVPARRRGGGVAHVEANIN